MAGYIKGFALALMVSGLAAGAALGQAEGPGSLWTLPSTGGDDYSVVDDIEFLSDIEFFVERGWTEPEWKTYEKLVEDVARELVVPDYVQRTGRDAPEHASIDIASAPITSAGFNNLLVASRLPGDCGPDGCLFQVWELQGETWRKVFEFTAIAFAYRDGVQEGTTDIAAVGGEDVPSRVYHWNGFTFSR